MNKVCMIKGFIEDIENILNNILVAPENNEYSSTLNAETGVEEFTDEALGIKDALEKLVDLKVGEITSEEVKSGEDVTGYKYTFTFFSKFDGVQGGNVVITPLGVDYVLAVVTAEETATENGGEG